MRIILAVAVGLVCLGVAQANAEAFDQHVSEVSESIAAQALQVRQRAVALRVQRQARGSAELAVISVADRKVHWSFLGCIRGDNEKWGSPGAQCRAASLDSGHAFFKVVRSVKCAYRLTCYGGIVDGH